MSDLTTEERIALVSHAIEGVSILEAMKILCSELACQVAAACEATGLPKQSAFEQTAEALSVIMLACGEAEREVNVAAANTVAAGVLDRLGVQVK
jgi:hypothetical protein